MNGLKDCLWALGAWCALMARDCEDPAKESRYFFRLIAGWDESEPLWKYQWFFDPETGRWDYIPF
jgi:hypothetical protein